MDQSKNADALKDAYVTAMKTHENQKVSIVMTVYQLMLIWNGLTLLKTRNPSLPLPYHTVIWEAIDTISLALDGVDRAFLDLLEHSEELSNSAKRPLRRRPLP